MAHLLNNGGLFLGEQDPESCLEEEAALDQPLQVKLVVNVFGRLAEHTLILLGLPSLVEAAYYVEAKAATCLDLLIFFLRLVSLLAWVLVDGQSFRLKLFLAAFWCIAFGGVEAYHEGDSEGK